MALDLVPALHDQRTQNLVIAYRHGRQVRAIPVVQVDDLVHRHSGFVSALGDALVSTAKPVDQEALEPTVYRLDYYDGDYYWYLVHSYDREELEKLIADATEYHKTIKDLDFDDDEAVDVWLEKHPLNDLNGDQVNDLLDIDDYEPLSEYLSIYSFEVRGVSE